MTTTQGFPRISSVYDHDNASPHSLLHSGSIRSTLMKLLPSDFFFSDESSDQLIEDFVALLPIFKWVEWGEPKKFIHRGIQNLANGNVGASDLQQAQPLALRTLAEERRIALLQEEQGLCKHKLDAASCKDEDADEASGQLLNHDVYISIFLLSRHRANGIKFFYEMISRWLIPGKRPNISSFFAVDFQFPDLAEEFFTLSEITVSLESLAELELVRHQLPILESEIRLGQLSVYHANRILEIKGLSADEKTSIIQERIISLLEKRPQDFDHGIFIQMQHFLVMCSEEFKSVREHGHMSRIIYVFYLFKKALKRGVESRPAHRFIHVKLNKTYLHLPFGLKKVVGIFLGLNLQSDNELFDERHFVAVLQNAFPQIRIIEESFFSLSSKDERIQLLYVEIEKAEGGEFALSEMKLIKEKLPDEVRGGIEKLTRPLFMPRNEEEVMRNIVILSNQLKFSRDLPQVVIAFDEQAGEELSFSVIWMRVLKPDDAQVQEAFAASSFLKFVPDRVKKVGLLRKKYPKEVTVFRVKFDAENFLRPDHSVDLFKARQAIVRELQRLLGDFRDYNGGMIAKQHEQFLNLKRLFPLADDLLLENFFHCLFPIELRSLFDLESLTILFKFLEEAVQKKDPLFLRKEEPRYCIVLLSYEDPSFKEKIIEAVRDLQIPSSQLLMLSQRVFEISYLGYIYLEENPQKRLNFLNLWEIR